MSDSFLSKFSKLPATTQPVSSTAQYSNTLPSSQCPGGFPVNNYAGYGDNSVDVLYSIWNSYQSTITPQFTQSQSNSAAPNEPTMVGPKNIFIIRHGEKTSSTPTTVQYHLNQNGIYRACQIPTLINQFAVNGYPITYLVAANPCPWNSPDGSMRQEQTLAMASFLLNIPMFFFGKASDNQEVADALFNIPAEGDPPNPFNGLNVLICWEHTAVQDLCIEILNKCSQVGRSSMNADQFFASVSSQTAVDGTYLAPEGKPPFSTGPPLNDASVNYPYWNTHNYDNMYLFFANPGNTSFNFQLTNQQYFNCLTCYPSCELQIGLYQPINNCTHSTYYYDDKHEIEPNCVPPTDWTYPRP
jgi:hypothetical protein